MRPAAACSGSVERHLAGAELAAAAARSAERLDAPVLATEVDRLAAMRQAAGLSV